jgi:hypothetical protein
MATLQKEGGALLIGNQPRINTPGYVIRWETNSRAQRYRNVQWIRVLPNPKSAELLRKRQTFFRDQPRTDYKPDLPSGPLAPSAPSATVTVAPAEASAPPQAGRMLFAEAVAVPAPAVGAPELPMAHATVYKGRM